MSSRANSGIESAANVGVGEGASAAPGEATATQLQLIRSRDLARRVAAKLDLASRTEYDRGGKDWFLTDLLVNLGLAKNPANSSAEEQVLARYYGNLDVHPVEGSRVIAIEFASSDPQFAADAANTIATEYIAFQREAQNAATADATRWLDSEIAELRNAVRAAEAKVATFRSEHLRSTDAGANAALRERQVADLNAELARVRLQRAETEARTAQIRAVLETGAMPSVTDTLNAQLIQRLVREQAELRSDIDAAAMTLLPEHPRLRALRARSADVRAQIEREARRILDTLEGEAQAVRAREAGIQQSLDGLAAAAATADSDEAELRSLEREAGIQRGLLDSYLDRYREMAARQDAQLPPAVTRVVSRATPSATPDFPRSVPLTAAAAAGALVLAVAFVLGRAAGRRRAVRRVVYDPVPGTPGPVPVGGHLRWADDHGVRRMMPGEPTLAPAIGSEVERSLAAIAARIVAEGKRRILVTLAEGSTDAGRPLAAVALVRALAKADRRAVLVDLRGDGADSAIMGEGANLPGFTDLFAGDASFAQVIFRDRKSRAHFIPQRPDSDLGRQALTGERLSTHLLGPRPYL